MTMKNFGLILSVTIGLGYIYWVIAGKFSLRPKDQYYNRLFILRDYFLNVAATLVLVIIGVVRVNYDARESMYFAPFIFLILFKLLDRVSLLVNDRHLILAIGHMDRPKGKDGHKFIDALFGFLLVFIPTITCGLIMNKLNHGVWMK
jgi:hypothetical protein